MDLRPKRSAVGFCLLLIFTISKFSEGQNLCSVEKPIIFFPENNTLEAVVTSLTADAGVTANIIKEVPAGLFSINGLNVIAITVLDFETFDTMYPYEVDIECTKDGFSPTTLNLRIIVQNINDNAPVFDLSEYTLNVNENTKENIWKMLVTKQHSPPFTSIVTIASEWGSVNNILQNIFFCVPRKKVIQLQKEDTSIGQFKAIDADEGDQIFYRLDPPEGDFGLADVFNPNILVKKLLDYDKVKKVTMTLYAQDTPLSSSPTVSHTGSTTITVNIVDVDNRPPWFQPCTESQIGNSTVCISSGYTGTVNLTQQATGPLTLMPGPVRATDGDKGINEPIGYRFLEENEIFEINPDSGDITTKKPVDVAGPIVLMVMAFQKQNGDQYATNTVILRVVSGSKHPPKFVKPNYEGFISEDAGVDSLVLESKTSNRPLRVQATDEDFANGVNPDIRFEVIGGTDFDITPEGFILMVQEVSIGSVNLQMRVVDTTNDESSTTSLTVEVTPGVPTTTTVTTITTTDQSTVKTTEQTTEHTTDQTTDQTTGTQLTDSIPTTHPDIHTTLGHTTEDNRLRVGGYRAEDMAAVGASLAVVIVLCLVGIGLLAHYVKSHNSDWKKLSEASVFRSNLGGGSGGPKEGVQYSNEGFQHDGDPGSVSSGLDADLEMKLESGARSSPEQTLNTASVPKTRAAPDSSSLASADIEKEVKPILTKERRAEEGYKAVWFKEDIDPNTKEEVVIIPDTGEPADHDEDDDDDDEDDEEHMKTDMDEEAAGRFTRDSDSEDEEGLTSDL